MATRTAVILAAVLAGAVTVYPEAPFSRASRTSDRVRTPSVAGPTPLLTQEVVESWVQRWQSRLGLTEWKIDTRIVRQAQLPKGTIANVQWSLPRRSATIKVLHPADSTLPAAEIVGDTELSIVHELVHLSMAKLPLDGGDPELEEEAVKRLSKALVALDKRESGR